MMGRQLISSVYWKGSLGQTKKKIKIGTENEGYVYRPILPETTTTCPRLSQFSSASEANTMNDAGNTTRPHSTRIVIIVINLKYCVYTTSRLFNLLNLSFIRSSCYSSSSQFISNTMFIILTLPVQGLIENVMGNIL